MAFHRRILKALYQGFGTGDQLPPQRPAMKIAAILLGLVAVCAAQEPRTCESPKQWEGRRILFDMSKKFTEVSRFAYDEVGQRTRAIEEIQQGTEREFYDVLTLHGLNREYRVDLRTKKCNITMPRGPFRPIGVPPSAHFLFEAEVGPSQIPNEHFTTAAFEGNFTTDHVRYVQLVTLPDCVPVGSNYYNDVTGFVESRYFDVKLGISDPEAFIPPSVCNMA